MAELLRPAESCRFVCMWLSIQTRRHACHTASAACYSDHHPSETRAKRRMSGRHRTVRETNGRAAADHEHALATCGFSSDVCSNGHSWLYKNTSNGKMEERQNCELHKNNPTMERVQQIALHRCSVTFWNTPLLLCDCITPGALMVTQVSVTDFSEWMACTHSVQASGIE